MRVSGIPMFAAVVLLCALWRGQAGAAVCPPAAVVQGSAPIVASVREILRAHGLSGEPSACPDQEVRASLEEGGAGRYHLRIRDAFGRQSEREVSDPETAASLIESWAVPAVDEVPPLAPEAPALRRSPPPAAVSAADAVRWRLAGAIELASGSDDSLWYGAALTGCATLAALCLGGRLRLAQDNSILGPDRDINRSATEALLLAAWPLVGRTVTVTPMVGVGAGWVHTGANPEDANTRESNDLGARVEAAASAGLALSAHLSLVAELGASWGLSLASFGRDDRAGSTLAVPGAYLRGALACQYSP